MPPRMDWYGNVEVFPHLCCIFVIFVSSCSSNKTLSIVVLSHAIYFIQTNQLLKIIITILNMC